MADEHLLDGVRVLAAINGLELFGHERGNIEVFKALRSMGAEVHVCANARDNGGEVGEELRRLGFPTTALTFGPQWSKQFVRNKPWIALSNPAAILRCSSQFRVAIRTCRATHIHIGSPLVYSYVSVALALSGMPVVYRMGDTPPTDSRFNLAIWKRAMRRATVVVANSLFVKQQAIAAGVPESKIRLIYNVAPEPAESVNSQAANLRTDEEATVLYVGSIAEHKGLLPLVDAVRELLHEGCRLRLEIVGGSIFDAQFRARIIERVEQINIASYVHFAGSVPDPRPYYRCASMLVVPSMWNEPAANVVIEAKREGTPVVVFPAGGLPELINHKIDGFICEERSAPALAAGIRWVLAEQERLQTLREAALSDYERRFAATRFMSEWSNVYTSTVK